MNSPREKGVWQRPEPALPDWPALAARVIDDISRIAEAEIRLFEIGLRNALDAEIDRAVKMTFAAVAISFGGLCVLVAAILLLHQLLHHWWMAFGAAGAFLLIAGATVTLALPRRGEPARASSAAGT